MLLSELQSVIFRIIGRMGMGEEGLQELCEAGGEPQCAPDYTVYKYPESLQAGMRICGQTDASGHV